MDHKEWLEQKLYVLLYTLLLGISCVYGIFTYYELPLYHLILVAGIIVWILLVIGFDYLYYIKSNKVLLYTLIVAIVVVVLGLLASIQFRIADYRYWLIHVGVRPTAKEMNANTWNLYYLATLLVSLVVVSSFYFICTIFIGRIFAAGAGMIAVLIMVIKESSVIQLIPASLFTYEVVFLIEICIKRCNFDKIKEKKCMSYMAYFPMFFYIILLCFVTTTDKPME